MGDTFQCRGVRGFSFALAYYAKGGRLHISILGRHPHTLGFKPRVLFWDVADWLVDVEEFVGFHLPCHTTLGGVACIFPFWEDIPTPGASNLGFVLGFCRQAH